MEEVADYHPSPTRKQNSMATHCLSNQSLWPSLPMVVVSLFLLALLYLFFKSGTQGARNSPCPPGPPKQLPVLGNLLQLGSQPHRYFQAIARRYGPVVQVQLGRMRAVVVTSPKAAKEVLRTNDLKCCSRPNSPGPRLLSYNFQDLIFSPHSDYCCEMRKLFVAELLSLRRVQSFAYARATEVDRLLYSLEASPPGTLVDLSEKLYAFFDGIIGTVALGNMYGSAQSFEKSSFQQVLHEMQWVLGNFTFEDFFPSSALARCADVLTGATWQRRRIFRKIDRFFDLVIDKHLEPLRLQAGVQEDMVDALVKMWREQDGALGLTRDHVKAIVMNIFVAGIDPPAITANWMMSELMRNPRVMQKAQAEVRNLVRNKPRVDEEDVQKLKYLKMVMKENFRLHPIVPLLLPRVAMQNCVIGGYNVLVGTILYVNVWAMGRDPTIWDSPEEFYPERFEDTHVDFRGSHFELLPFGSGRRSCPGIAMGVANVELVLANLLYCFDWELPKGMKEEDIDMKETGQIVFHKAVPLCVVPIKHGWS